MSYDFTPYVCVGEFYFNTLMGSYLEKLKDYTKRIDEYNYTHFTAKDDSYMVGFDEDDLLYAVYCYKVLTYNNTNLIGLTFDELQLITGWDFIGEPEEFDIDDDNTPQYVYDFENFGSLVWTKNGVVVSMTLYRYVD